MKTHPSDGQLASGMLGAALAGAMARPEIRQLCLFAAISTWSAALSKGPQIQGEPPRYGSLPGHSDPACFGTSGGASENLTNRVNQPFAVPRFAAPDPGADPADNGETGQAWRL